MDNKEKELLVNYLKTIIKLESKKIEYSFILRNLNEKIKATNNPRFQKHIETPNIPTDESKESNGCIVMFLIPAILCCGIADDSIVSIIIYFSIVSAILLYLIKEKIAEKNKYKRAMEQYRLECDLINNKNKEIDKINKSIKRNAAKIATDLTNDYQYIKQLYYNTETTLQKYYRLDILYSKYKNFVCVASILDYFQAGICTELGGSNGAYNKLDQEILLKTIITKLDTAIDHLKDIKSNQIVLHNAIVDGFNNSNLLMNRLVDNNSTLVETINSNGKTIYSHLAAIEYSQRRTEENSRYLLDLESYKYWSDNR